MSKERRPFHETIVRIISVADSDDKLAVLVELCLDTKIPANHDAIIAAWREHIDPELGEGDGEYNIDRYMMDAVADLEEQKLEAEEKARQREAEEQRRIVEDAKIDRI